MLRFIPTILLGAIALPAPAEAPRDSREQAQIAKRLSGLQAGAPQACITQSRTRGSIHAGDTVLIEDTAGVRYLSRFQGGCSIPANDGLIHRSTSSRLCAGEIVEGRDFVSGTFSGSCTYGEFTPYRRPRR